jgi:hypothetical protein
MVPIIMVLVGTALAAAALASTALACTALAGAARGGTALGGAVLVGTALAGAALAGTALVGAATAGTLLGGTVLAVVTAWTLGDRGPAASRPRACGRSCVHVARTDISPGRRRGQHEARVRRRW